MGKPILSFPQIFCLSPKHVLDLFRTLFDAELNYLPLSRVQPHRIDPWQHCFWWDSLRCLELHISHEHRTSLMEGHEYLLCGVYLHFLRPFCIFAGYAMAPSLECQDSCYSLCFSSFVSARRNVSSSLLSPSWCVYKLFLDFEYSPHRLAPFQAETLGRDEYISLLTIALPNATKVSSPRRQNVTTASDMFSFFSLPTRVFRLRAQGSVVRCLPPYWFMIYHVGNEWPNSASRTRFIIS